MKLDVLRDPSKHLPSMPLQALIALSRCAKVATSACYTSAAILLLLLALDSAKGVSYHDAPGELIEQKYLR